MAKFLLLLTDTPSTFSGMSPEEIQAIIGKYRAWRQKLTDAGKLHGGHKLKDEGGKIMTRRAGQVSVVDGPFVETKEIIGGYFVMEAENYNEAVELSRDCPHLAYGTIEIREIEIMP
jgi:hypothetical protein